MRENYLKKLQRNILMMNLVQKMAEICVESDSMARGVRSIVGALVEDALFNGAAKGEVRFGRTDVEAVAEQLF